jgi:Na+/pantothenate symporter
MHLWTQTGGRGYADEICEYGIGGNEIGGISNAVTNFGAVEFTSSVSYLGGPGTGFFPSSTLL